MPTTPNLNLPYPSPEAAATAGAVNLRQLAEALDTHLARQWATGAGPTPTLLDTANPATVAYDIPDLGSGHFTYAGGVFTYDGAEPRFFMVSAGILLTVTGAVPANIYSRLTIMQNDSAQVHDRDQGPIYVGHHPTTTVRLEPGDTIWLEVEQDNTEGVDASASERYIRLVSL